MLAVAEPAVKGAFPYGKIYAGVLGLGFVAAVSLGSIAFYNSKRPVGWEDKDRPGFVPKVDTNDEDQ
ncbi:photosystem II assembly protein Psb35 [Lyngbya confervoides]|uniref:Uncharacterized protein n=1 Tax=Lyngbya confervoides BDU141951 TaxID=1574623 RepID=A0ABD4T3W8_9CYAN|nr:hypothetical protein [Lyngbya confervoides]MCM1983417.1 hypothetical protein [Lyngbya confervoides BDU141951]